MPGVFISYAREDRVFVRRLYDALLAADREPVWDQDHGAVPFSAPWRPEIQAAIENSDKFIFVISPDSLDSGPCGNELEYAMEVNKRVIPVVRRRPREGAAPSSLADLNWIFFDDDADFDRPFSELTTALDTDLDWTKAHTRLLVRSSEWIGAKKDRSLVLRGNDLRAAESWLADADNHAEIPPTLQQREYVVASRRAADRSARLWRGALASGLVVALVLATIAFVQRNQARHEASVAQARALAAEATADLAVDPASSLELALQSTQVDPSAAGIQALRLALATDRMRMAFQPGFGTGTQATWSPAAEIIAATGRGNSVQLWDPRTGRLLRTLGSLPAADPISQLSYNGQGSLLAGIAGNGRVAMWDPQNGAAVDLSQLNADIRADQLGKSVLGVLTGTADLNGAWDPQSGDLFLYGPGLRGILVFLPATGRIVALRTPAPIFDLAFAPSGSRAFVFAYNASSFQGLARIVDFSTGTFVTVQEPASLYSGWGINETACWTPDGSEIVTWNPLEAQDQTLRAFSPRTGAELFERPGSTTFSAAACGAIRALGPYAVAGDYAGDGTLLQTRDLVYGPDDAVRQEFTVVGLYGHTQRINSVATSSDGYYVATGSNDGTVRIWDAVTGSQLSLIPGNGQPVEAVQFSRDGGTVLAVTANGVVQVADAGTGEPDVPLDTPATGSTYALGFADGSRLVYGVNEVTEVQHDSAAPRITSLDALLWQADTGMIAASYRLPAPPSVASPKCPRFSLSSCEIGSPAQEFTGFTVSEDGDHFAYVSPSGVVARSFSGGGSSKLLRLSVPPTGVAFAGPADDLIVMTNQIVDVWRPFGDGRLTRIPQPSPPFDAEISDNGDLLATANIGGVAIVWDPDTGRPLASFHPHPVHVADPPSGSPIPVRVAVNPGGTELAVGTNWGSVDLWQIHGHRLLTSRLVAVPQTAIYDFAVGELDFSDNGSEIVAVDYSQPSAGLAEPPGTALVVVAQTGQMVAVLSTPAAGGAAGPAVNPGVALSPDGSYVLGGVEGFAPVTAVAGDDAIYDLGSSEELADLQNTLAQAPPVLNQVPNLVPVNAWAADGIHLLTGGPAVYACDACGSLTQMQSAAQLRLDWAVPLTPARDDPPGGDAFS